MTRRRSAVAEASTQCQPPSTRPASSIADTTMRDINGHATTTQQMDSVDESDEAAPSGHDNDHILRETCGPPPPPPESSQMLGADIDGIAIELKKKRRAARKARVKSGANSEPIRTAPVESPAPTEKKASRTTEKK